MPPVWDPANLTAHHQKRITKDKGCFEDLMGIADRDMTEPEYESRSLQVFGNAWGEFEGESWDRKAGGFYPRAAHFVDGVLVVLITDIGRAVVRTCYHEHFGRAHGAVAGAGVAVGQRRLRYRQKIAWDENGGMIRNLKRIRGV